MINNYKMELTPLPRNDDVGVILAHIQGIGRGFLLDVEGF